MTKKQGLERETVVARGGTDGDVSSVVTEWEFLKERLPDLLNDPLEKVQEFVDSLPFASEVKDRLFKLVKNQRETK